jgi:hypothetical protein
MIEFLSSLDLAVFHFINVTLANPVGDFLWPLITDYDRLQSGYCLSSGGERGGGRPPSS